MLKRLLAVSSLVAVLTGCVVAPNHDYSRSGQHYHENKKHAKGQHKHPNKQEWRETERRLEQRRGDYRR